MGRLFRITATLAAALAAATTIARCDVKCRSTDRAHGAGDIQKTLTVNRIDPVNPKIGCGLKQDLARYCRV